jgi:hypothetical protein
MIQRKTFRVDEHCEIALTTERMADGWGVVASVKHRTGDAERIVDLPVPTEKFASEAEAEGSGSRWRASGSRRTRLARPDRRPPGSALSRTRGVAGR